MKKFFVLALVAVFAMASVSMAGVTILGGGASVTVSDPVLLDFGLAAYTIHFDGTKTFDSLAVEGAVHQIFQPAANETPYAGDIAPSPAPPLDPTPFDTHFMFPLSGITVGQANDGVIETSTQANEQALTQEYLWWFNAGTPLLEQCTAGLGTFDTTGATKALGFTFAGELNPAGYDILYVVQKADALNYLVGSCSAGGETRLINAPIGVPEPGTIFMLVAGALCLMGARFRK